MDDGCKPIQSQACAGNDVRFLPETGRAADAVDELAVLEFASYLQRSQHGDSADFRSEHGWVVVQKACDTELR